MADDIGYIINTHDDIARGMAHLCSIDQRFQMAYDMTGPLPLRRSPDGFATLLKAIVGQQVSVASTNAMWARLEQGGFTDMATVAGADLETLRAHGLSRQKASYAMALGSAGIDFLALRSQSNDQVISTLVAVKGIGPWTAEIYAMFALGRADVFAPGDLALQEGAKLLFDLPARPTAKELAHMAAAWSPWRAVAARLLWAYYAVEKQREGIA